MYIWGFDTKKGCNSNLKSFSHNFLHYISGYPKYQIVGLELGDRLTPCLLVGYEKKHFIYGFTSLSIVCLCDELTYRHCSGLPFLSLVASLRKNKAAEVSLLDKVMFVFGG